MHVFLLYRNRVKNNGSNFNNANIIAHSHLIFATALLNYQITFDLFFPKIITNFTFLRIQYLF